MSIYIPAEIWDMICSSERKFYLNEIRDLYRKIGELEHEKTCLRRKIFLEKCKSRLNYFHMPRILRLLLLSISSIVISHYVIEYIDLIR